MSQIAITGDWHLGEHDRHALGLFFAYAEQHHPDTIVLNGDVIDCTELHRSQQGARVPIVRGRSALQLGEEVVVARRVLGRLRRVCPRSRIVYLEGNHEARYPRYLARQCPEAYGHLPTLPDLLGLADLGIEWQTYGVPLRVADWWVTHGHKTTIHACRTLVQDYCANVVQGHSHRLKAYPHTTPYGRTMTGVEGGHLRDRRAAYTPTEWPQWQQGWVVLTERTPSDYAATLVSVGGESPVATLGAESLIRESSTGLLRALRAAASAIAQAAVAAAKRGTEGGVFED